MENSPAFSNVAEDENSQGGVKNAYYTIMVDYSRTNRTIQDNVHKDNYFNYGHIGRLIFIKHHLMSFQISMEMVFLT